MIFAPGSFSRIDSARSAVTKSPGTNSPVSSTKKQRSASPSNAAPKSAPSSSVLRDDELAVLGQERVRLVVREGPSGSKKQRTASIRQPLEHGRQHRAGHPVRRVDHDVQRLDRGDVDEREDVLDERGPDVVALGRSRRLSPGTAGSGQGAVADRRAARSRRRPAARRARTIFMPVYSFGLCEAVTAIPPSRPSSPTAR